MSSHIPSPASAPSQSAASLGNPFEFAREHTIRDDWALRLDPETDTPERLRAGAFAIMSEGFGIKDPTGRVFSGAQQNALDPKEYFAKARACWDAGSLAPVQSEGWNAYHDAAEKGDRATMRRLARENIRGEDAGNDVAAAWDPAMSRIGLKDDWDMERELLSVRDVLTPEEIAIIEESGRARAEKTAQTEFASDRFDEDFYENASAFDFMFARNKDLRDEETKARHAEANSRLAEVYRRHANDIRDEQRLPAYEKQLADENLWATVQGLRGAVSDDAWRVVEMAQQSAGSPTQKRVIDAFEKLTTTEQRSVAGVLHALHYGRDTTLVGDAFRSFWDTAAQTVGGSARAIADVFRRGVMDGEEYRDMVERRALLEQANSGRMKEWGYLGQSVVGAFSTIPYMAVAAIPYAGPAAIMASASDQFQTEAALNGVDVGSREFMLTNWAFSGAYAAVEKLQVVPFKPLKNVSRRQMYCEMFHSLRSALFVAGGVAGTTVSESVEEGIQGGIERVVEGWGLGHDQAKEFAAGFASDFVGSLGTMAIIGAGGAGVQHHRYRSGAFSPEEAISATARVADLESRIKGHPEDAAVPLGEFSREFGMLGRDWVNAGTDGTARVRALMRWGFTPEQATRLHGMFSEIWKGVGGDEDARSAFVGGNRVRSAAELLADTLGVQVEDGENGEKSVSFRIGRGRVNLRFNPADRIETAVDVNDRTQAADVVEILNRNEEATTGTRGTMTVDEWLALPEEVRREQTKGMTVQGGFKIDAPDGTSVGEDALRVLSGRVIETDVALPQTVFHESMHAVLRLLREEAAADPEAKALQEELAKVYAPQEGIDEAVNEEALADGYQTYLTSLTTAVEDTGVFARLKRWIARLLGRATVARDSLRAAQSAQGRLFNLALTGDLTPAMRKEEAKPEGPSSGEQGTKPVENPATAEPAAARYQVASAPAEVSSAADQMERDGATREDIWNRLGAYRGVDGLWRVEVNDLEWKDANAAANLTKLLTGGLEWERPAFRRKANWSADNPPTVEDYRAAQSDPAQRPPSDKIAPIAKEIEWAVQAEAVRRAFDALSDAYLADRDGADWRVLLSAPVGGVSEAVVGLGGREEVRDAVRRIADKVVPKIGLREWFDAGVLDDASVLHRPLTSLLMEVSSPHDFAPRAKNVGECEFGRAADESWKRLNRIASRKHRVKNLWGKLGDFVDSGLLRADESLAAVPLMPGYAGGGQRGSFNEYSGITVKAGLTAGEMLSVLSHEVQHYVQRRDGFATGGSTEFAGSLRDHGAEDDLNEELRKQRDVRRETAERIGLAEFRKETERRIDRELSPLIEKAKAEGRDPTADEAVLERMNALADEQEEAEREFLRQHDAGGYYDSATRRIRALEGQLGALMHGDYEVYRSLAGEVEARVVQARRDMTPEERKAEPPWITAQKLGYPERNQLVTYNGSLIPSAVGMRGNPAADLRARYSVTPAEDATYLDAVSRGDMETAQRMVREAAERAGYDTFGFHGTRGEFTVFDKKRIGTANDEGWLGRGFYFWDRHNEDYAQQYARGGKVMEVYLSMQEPYFIGNEEMERLIDASDRHDVEALEEFTDNLKEEGYDSVIDNNGQMLVFEPNQIKSADPVTYDDAGNVIPLSQRFNTERDDIRYQITPATPDELEALASHFGTTRIFSEAGYILPDGRVLDFSGRADGYTVRDFRRHVDHREITEYVDSGEEGSGSGSMNRVLAAGGIRLMPETGGIDLAVKPTAEQESQLRDYIDRFNGEVSVDISRDDGENVTSAFYRDGTRASRVLNEIKAHFDTGAELRGTGEQADGSFRYQISGQVGAEALGIRGLADAEAMERSGADRLAIWRETGWWRGRDGEWRVEIPDFELKSAKTVSSALKGGREAKLDELIDAPELFAAYPALRYVGVDISEYPSASASTTTQGKGTADADRYDHISVSKKVNDVASFRSILAHEIQHIIQGREGFSMGGDVNLVYMPGTEVGNAAFSELAKRRKDIRTPMSREEYRKAAGFDESDLGTKDFEDSYRGYVRSLKNIPRNIDVALQETVARDIYHRIAGEAEARLVQKRLGMTPEERAARPPWEDFDVAESEQIVLGVERSLPKPVRESPSYDGIDADTDAPRFSIATYENGGRETLEKWLASQTKGKNATLSKEDAAQILAETDFIADVARSLARKKKRFAAFSNWSEARVELDSEGRPYFGVVRTNGDYAMNIDFSTVCKKRRPMDRIFSRLVRDGILTGANVNELSGEAVAGIQRIIKAHGLEVACALCFVDAKRYRLGDVAKRFADGGTTGEGKYFPGWNSIVEAQAKGGKKWKDRVKAAKGKKDFESRCVRAIDKDPALRVRVDGARLVSSEGMDAFARERPGIYELWSSYGGTSHAKDSHWDAPYNNDIIRPFASRTNDKKRTFDRAKAYAIGGVRLQSFSDFVGRMFFDYAQMFAELAGKRLPLHTYTKEPNFVKIFHRTRAKINMSLVPAVVDVGIAPGLDADGNYVWADECFPPDEAFALRSLGSNVGTIAVGVSGKHIRKLLRDPRIDMVIPYHASGINPVVANIRRIDEFFDYTSEQNTRNADGSKYTGKEHFDFYGSLARTNDPKATASEYFAWCDERGLLPKFDKFRDEENYYKLLADFRLYDDAGNYAPQEDVRQEYPDDLGRLVEEAVAHDQEAEDTFAEEEDAIVAEIEASILGPRVAEAERAAGDAARASVVWNGPAYSYKSFATAYAARDRILGIDRPDDDYRRLLETMGVSDYSVDDLKADAEKIRARGLGRNEATLQRLAGLAEQESMARTVESLMRGSLELGEDVGSSARRAYETYLARMRRTAKGRDYTDLTADLGFDLADLALAIDPEAFAPQPKPDGDATPPAGGSDAETGAVADEDPEVAALLDGKAADFGLTEEQLRERIRERMEQRTQEIRERLERIRARLDEWRAKEARRKAKLAERQEAEGKSDAPADLPDAEMFDEEQNETEAGAKRLADYESECVEEMPDFRAFLEECRRDGLDLSDAAEFVAAVRIWSEDFIARETGADPEKVLRDPVNLARYRATMMEFLHGMADSLLDPEDGAAAKTAERMMQEIPSDATVGEIDGRARTIVGFIQRNGIRQTRKQLIRELRKGIKLEAIRGKKWDEMERDAGRKVTGEREAAARYLYRILTWSDGMIAKESARLHDIVAGREDAYRSAGADDAALKDLARTDREVHRAAEKLQALQMYGGLRKKSPAEIKLAARAIMSWLTEEREAHEKRWNDWHARLDALAQRAAKAASASAQDYTPEDPGRVGKLADELTATIRQRLEQLFVGGGADARAVIDEVMRLVYTGSERMRAETAAARRRTDEMLERCVQGTGRNVRQFLKDLDAPIPEDLNRQLRTAEQPVRMTNGQALQLLASLEQVASYAGNIEANGRGAERVVGTDPDGNPITEPQTPHAELLRRYFSDKPEMVRLLEGMREVYEERRGALSDTFRAVTGNPILAPDPLYAPVKMFRGSSEGFETQVRAWDPFGPALQPRIKNTLDFDLSASIMDVYNNRTRETCRALAWGIPGMELRSVLCRREVQDAIARTHGKFPLRQLVAHLTDLVSDGWADEPSGFKWLAQTLGGATTYSALSWNVVTALKQTASIPAWTALMDGGYAEVFRNIANFDRAAARELMDAPGFAARYGADSFAQMFKDAIRDPNANPLQRFFQAGMTAVQMGDFVPGILVGTGVYKAKKLALMRQGLEERQAREEAARIAWGLIEECQQSSRLENSPAFLRRGGFLARQAAKFASSPLLQVSHEVHTLRMWAAEAKAEARRNGGGVRMWSKSEDVARWRKRFWNQVLCNHVLMPVAMYAVATAFNLALGSEPPDKEEVIGDIVMQMISGPFGRVFLLGMIFDKGGETVARAMGGKPNVYDSTGLAAQQYLQKLFGQLGRIGGDVADADWESVRDDLLKMLGHVSAPARYAVKIGQNAAGYDPAEARRERKAEIRRERGE